MIRMTRKGAVPSFLVAAFQLSLLMSNAISGSYSQVTEGPVCEPNPCKNGGVCFPQTDTSSFFCLCVLGYSGKTCDGDPISTTECFTIAEVCSQHLNYTSSTTDSLFPVRDDSPFTLAELRNPISLAFILDDCMDHGLQAEACGVLYPPCLSEGVETQICSARCPLLQEKCGNLDTYIEIDCSQLTADGQVQPDGRCLEFVDPSSTLKTDISTDGAVSASAPATVITEEFVAPSSTLKTDIPTDGAVSATAPATAITEDGSASCIPIPAMCSQHLSYTYATMDSLFPVSESSPFALPELRNPISLAFIIDDCMEDGLQAEACGVLYPPCPSEGVETQICSASCSQLYQTCGNLRTYIDIDCSQFTSYDRIQPDGRCSDDHQSTDTAHPTTPQTTTGLEMLDTTVLVAETDELQAPIPTSTKQPEDVTASQMPAGMVVTDTSLTTEGEIALVTVIVTDTSKPVTEESDVVPDGTTSMGTVTDAGMVSPTSTNMTPLEETEPTTTGAVSTLFTVIDTSTPTTDATEGTTDATAMGTSTNVDIVSPTSTERADMGSTNFATLTTAAASRTSPMTPASSSGTTNGDQEVTTMGTSTGVKSVSPTSRHMTTPGETTTPATETTKVSANGSTPTVTGTDTDVVLPSSSSGSTVAYVETHATAIGTSVDETSQVYTEPPISTATEETYSPPTETRSLTELPNNDSSAATGTTGGVNGLTNSSDGRVAYSSPSPTSTDRLASSSTTRTRVTDPPINGPLVEHRNEFEEELKNVSTALSAGNVTEQEVESAAQQVTKISKNDTFLKGDPERVELVIESLESIVDTGYTTENVTEPVVDIVNNLMDVDEEVINQGTSEGGRAVAALEELVTNVQENEGNVTIVRENVGVVAVKVDKRNLGGNLVFAVAEDSERDDEDDRELTTMLYDDEGEIPAVEMTTSVLVPRALIQSFEEDETNSTTVPISFIVYKNDVLFTPSMLSKNYTEDRREDINEVIISNVISARIEGGKHQSTEFPLKSPLVATFFLDVDFEFNETTTKHCVLWEYNAETRKGSWTEEGCEMVDEAADLAVCECRRFASFAILVRVDNGDVVLYYITLIGSIISGICLIVCLITFFSLKSLRVKQPTHIHINLCGSLLGFYVAFMLSIPAARNTDLCKVASAAIHFFSLATVSWMTAEAVNMYFLFVKMERRSIKYFIPVACVLAYGLSAVCVILTVFFDKQTQFERASYCFIQPGNALYFGFLMEVAALFVFNFFIFVWIIRKMLCRPLMVSKTDKNAKRKEIITRVRHGILFWFVLGLSWFFGFLSAITVDSKTFVFDYLYCIFTALQGLMIFLLLCVANPEFRKVFSRLSKRDVSQTDSSNLTASRSTSRRTSESHIKVMPPEVEKHSV